MKINEMENLYKSGYEIENLYKCGYEMSEWISENIESLYNSLYGDDEVYIEEKIDIYKRIENKKKLVYVYNYLDEKNKKLMLEKFVNEKPEYKKEDCEIILEVINWLDFFIGIGGYEDLLGKRIPDEELKYFKYERDLLLLNPKDKCKIYESWCDKKNEK